MHATFLWDANPDKEGGTMDLEVTNSRVKRLIIALDSF